MGFGINQTTNITIENLTSIINGTGDPTEFFINVNHSIYNGWLFFTLLCVLWFIIYRATNEGKDQPLNSAMYASAIVSIGSFFLRAIYMTKNGVIVGLITDSQLWLFPLLTAITLVIIWATKE